MLLALPLRLPRARLSSSGVLWPHPRRHVSLCACSNREGAGSYFFALARSALERGFVRGLLWRIVEDHLHVILFLVQVRHDGLFRSSRFNVGVVRASEAARYAPLAPQDLSSPELGSMPPDLANIISQTLAT